MRCVELFLSGLVLSGLASASDAAAPTAAAAAAGASTQQAQGYHVVEIFKGDSLPSEQLLKVLVDLGADKEKSDELIKKVDAKGKAVVVAGSKESCEDAAEHFTKIGMKTEVRPLVTSDLPSEYDESDVVVAGPTKLNELLEADDAGVLVAF